ncbi:hypothetical protein AMTR_s00028p00175540 [Amborella trichopoda]|uniref:Uncharacterized protein n=1 Tax=Amborella trichopoda TaxID=13333 RepID=W1PRF0_AMBTC|nr:hypothetical protein AMTR_s00028p00175540 [Amborella trichopoda]
MTIGPQEQVVRPRLTLTCGWLGKVVFNFPGGVDKFDDLSTIFGQGRGGMALVREGRVVPHPAAQTGGRSRFESASKRSCDLRVPAAIEPRGVPLRGREDEGRGRKRKGVGTSRSIPGTWRRDPIE